MASPPGQKRFRSPFVLARLLQSRPSSQPTPVMAKPTNPSTLREPATAMSSLSLTEDRNHAAMSREEKVASFNGDPSMSTANGTLISEQAQHQIEDPHDSMFVKGHESDDVFGSDTRLAATQQLTPADTSNEGPRVTTDDKLATPASKHAPRADRVGSPITPANAQGVLPPEACVFVANLSTGTTDEQLEFECHKAFDVYGDCVIKVRRDRHKHPFALVQFYNIEDATRALQEEHHAEISGRRVRTEPAQAKRSVVLAKVGGGSMTREEASQALSQYGPIEKLYPTTEADIRKLGCPDGMWVEFDYYLDYKDALKYFNWSNNGYHLWVPPESRAQFQPNAIANDAYNPQRNPRSMTDQKSIFLGNLPHDINETELRELFSKFGDIKAINIIHKAVHGSGFNVFGFIEFATAEDADHAAHQEIDIRGQRIRVEPKEYSARRHTRLHRYDPMTPYGANRYGYPGMHGPFGMHHDTRNHNFYHGGHGGYSYGMQHGVNPYSPTGYGVFHTPPQSTRMPPRRNNMAFSGSPHNIPMFTPASVPPSHFGTDQNEDNIYGNHSMYQGNC